MRRAVVVQWVFAFLAGAAAAGDGVIEINQVKALAGGVDACDTPGFPVTICKPGSYRLTSNLDVPRGELGIFIGTGNVSLDLGGMTVAGTSLCLVGSEGWVVSCTSHGAAGIVAGAGYVAVRNGTVGGFDACVSGDRSMRVSDVTVAGCAYGVIVAADSRVERVLASSNSGTGILCVERSRISDVVASHNQNGVVATGVLTGITATNNARMGIGLLDGATLRDFSAEGNGIRGVDAATGSGVLVSSGTIRNSGVAATTEYALVLGPGGGYREVIITSVNGGNSASVLGGANLGDNLCQGAPCP